VTSLLAAEDLTVRFAGLTALDDVSIRVERGQIAAVIGPNGAGKTTLFNCISGFVVPNAGHVALDGRRVDHLSPAQRAGAGLGRTFQQGGLWLSETVLGNLLVAQHLTVATWSIPSLLALGGDGRSSEADRRRMAEEVLAVLGLERYAHVPVRSLPYGSRKVLELGCALASRPAVLMLDEPAAGMGPEEGAWLASVISGIRAQLGVALLVIEHHVPLVKQVADVVYVLNFGRVLTAGTADEVTRDPAVLEAYLGHRAADAEPDGRRRRRRKVAT